MIEELRRLKRRLQPYNRLRHQMNTWAIRSIAEHAGMLDALTAGDEGQAEERMRVHIAIKGETVTDWAARFNVTASAKENRFA